MNFGDTPLVDFNLDTELGFTLPAGSEGATVVAMTSNLAGREGYDYKVREAIDVGKVKLAPYSGVLFKYK